MANWLLKTEPDTYSYDDLVKAKRDVWDGVANPTALKNMREMKTGDAVFIYHTGDEKSVVGIAEVVKAAYPDPKSDDEKSVVIDLKPKTRLEHPVSLKTIKADKAFAGWELVRIPRLSVMPVPQKMWDHIIKLSNQATNKSSEKTQ